MNLRKYFNKNVRIRFTDEEVIEGFVETYTPSIDSPDEQEEISIYKKGTKYPLIGIIESEIKSIKIL